MKNWCVIFSLFFVIQSVTAQVTSVRVMTYNILNYRNSTNACNGNTNSANNKEVALDTIVRNMNPHVICFQEVGASANNSSYLLNNALNTGNTTNWTTTNYTNNSFSSLTNVFAYRSDILGLISQEVISKDLTNNNLVRVVDVARFYFKDPLLSAQSDTVTFTLIGAHFKAGTGTSNSSQRNKMAAAIIDYIENDAVDANIMLLGDYNMYASSESGYRTLIAGNGFRFEDPINSSGSWNNNSSFASVHTQSTRNGGSNSCFSGGGLDDRFDQILCSEAILEGDDGMTYVPNTYFAVGNDGNHFNDPVNTGTNYSVSSTVLNALFTLSDHLPVIADFDIEMQGLYAIELNLPGIENPILQPAELGDYYLRYGLELYTLEGKMVFKKMEGETHTIQGLPAGLYIAHWTKEGRSKSSKLMLW
ncbi:MAG: hypothetical protein CMP53_09510 [Flavobacteriales bacterium]|nr:hypothetical protein [Flavobacteriales bacterium]